MQARFDTTTFTLYSKWPFLASTFRSDIIRASVNVWQELVADLELLAVVLTCHLMLYDYEGYSTSRLEGCVPSEVID
jgi:hypothetical protein